MPLPAVKLLAFANSVVKLVFVFVKAVYKESLPVGSFGSPILILCCPGIAMFLVPYPVFINKEQS